MERSGPVQQQKDRMPLSLSNATGRIAAMMCVLLCLSAPSCSEMWQSPSPRASEAGWSSYRLATTSPDVAYEAAVATMRQYFRVVSTSERGEGVVQSGEQEYSQAGGTGRLRDDALRFKNRMRRTATFHIVDAGSGCTARCQVRVQRLDTSDHRTFNDRRDFSDVPNETPIDREAGATASQTEQWTEMPRDRRLEREMLEVLANQIARVSERS